MLFLLIFAIITFVIFYKRAAQVGEKRKMFWGFSGVAAFTAPTLVVVVLFNFISLFFGENTETSKIIINLASFTALLAGGSVAKWALDRLLPLPEQPLDGQVVLVSDDEEEGLL